MCLAIPAQIINLLSADRAIASVGGIEREISTVLVEKITVGDYVIIHVGYALTKLDEVDAQKSLQLLAKMEPNA